MSDDLSMTALEYALGTLPADERAVRRPRTAASPSASSCAVSRHASSAATMPAMVSSRRLPSANALS